MESSRQEHNYVNILISSLNKKRDILSQILDKNEEQKDAISALEFDEETFDNVYSEKGKLIAELNLLDSGFESVFNRVRLLITEHPEMYKDEILEMKSLIGDITKLGMEIEASEKRNKEMMDNTTSDMQNKVNTAKATNAAATNYYYNMNRLNVVDPQFLDKKK